MDKLTIEKYADVLVRVGINLQKGQYLLLQCSPDSLDLARAVTKKAFEAGAKDVHVIIDDPEIKHLRGLYAKEEELRKVPDFRKEEVDYYLRNDGCQMGLFGTYPTLMDDVKKENAIAIFEADNDVRNVVRKYINKGVLQWTGTAVANMDWAKKVYEELDEEDALKQLEKDVAAMMRIDEEDPVLAWKKHCDRLAKVSKKLNELNFKSLHITTGLGTDIKMDLVKDHIWTSAADMGEAKVKAKYIANMPTEEIFSDPHRESVNGIAYASRPLTISGKLVKDFWIKFENGLAVDCGASQNVEVLYEKLMASDDTRRLGEVALVSKTCKIAKLNRIYYNGLIDENAASHLAFGSSFPSNVKGGLELSEEELINRGVNFAHSHTDFMIGTDDMKVVGTTFDGKEIIIMEEGDFVE